LGSLSKIGFGFRQEGFQVHCHFLESSLQDCDGYFSRFDYDGAAKKLIIQIPSDVHEAAVESIMHSFTTARVLTEQMQKPRNTWAFHTGKNTWYADKANEGMFTADGTITVSGEPVLLLEVACSQPWKEVHDKVVWILNREEAWRTLLGVLVIKIEESPRWTSPSKASVSDNYIKKDRWDEAARQSQRQNPFGGINIAGNAWVGQVQVDICLFQQPWNNRYPARVSFRSLIMNNY
jgi:hypothetical protein